MQSGENINQATKGWDTRGITLSEANGPSESFFALFRMTTLRGHVVQCTNLRWFDCGCSRGLTLLEISFVLAVISILGGIVLLEMRPVVSRTRLYTGARQVNGDLQLARAKSISHNRRFRVTFRAATNDYIVEKNEDSAWSRHLLHGHSTAEVPEATISLPSGVRIVAVNSNGDVMFLPRGAVDGGITITLGTVSGEETKQVIVNLAGRVRIE
jgi:prepilin-type N-terminal cleavage/methylation domain-containing protein